MPRPPPIFLFRGSHCQIGRVLLKHATKARGYAQSRRGLASFAVDASAVSAPSDCIICWEQCVGVFAYSELLDK